MRYDVPRHELTAHEVDTMRTTGAEAWRLEREWIDKGRVCVDPESAQWLPPLEDEQVQGTVV